MKKVRLFAGLLALLLLAASFSACAAKSSDEMYNSAADDSKSESWAYDAEPEAPAETEEAFPEANINTIGYDAAADTDDSVSNAQLDSESLADKMIYSADLTIQTTEYDDAISALESAVTNFGGFIERSNTYGDLRYNDDGSTRIVNRSADYTVRIPATRFGEFLAQADGLGNVLSTNRYAENVTSQYTDYEARLSSLRTQEERLLSMLEQTEDVESLIALEERLSDVRYELESIERNLRNLDRKIAYSTITISLQEVEIYTPTKPVQRTFGEKIRDAFSDGWRNFTRGFQSFVIDLIYALPGLILFLLIVGTAILLLVKLCKKRRLRKNRQKAASSDTPESDASKPDSK